jgi:hypothetical protein
MHLAAIRGNMKMLEFLIANKARVNAKNNKGRTPLHEASDWLLWHSSLKDAAELLIVKGADVNGKDNFGETPLHLAAGKGYKDMVELLIANKADVNAKDNAEMTPLQKAAKKGSDDVVALLIANKADVNPQETYRVLKIGDGIKFAIHGGEYNDFFSEKHPSGTIVSFGLVDSGGRFIELELRDHNYTDGVIETKMFGDIIYSLHPQETYAATETQIKKMHDFLSAHAEKSTTPSKVEAEANNIGGPPANWPSSLGELVGSLQVRVKNPNNFKVRVGLRSDGKGKDFVVSPNGTESVQVPTGRYDIYFNYSSDPGGLYQGDSFSLKDNGVEITITEVVNGNYGIRKVK